EGFLGSEAFGEVIRLLPVILEALQLGRAENAFRKSLPESLERLFDARHLDDVGAHTVDHRASREEPADEAASVISRFISRTASRMPTNTARLTMAWPMCSSRTPGSAATGWTLK